MPQTPDRHPGALQEWMIALRSTNDLGVAVTDPSNAGEVTYHTRNWAMRDAEGVFNPRKGGETISAITLAVNAGTGSDTPSTNRPAFIPGGTFSSYPFATLQAALDALPKVIKHSVTINVAAGSYAGFSCQGFVGAMPASGPGATVITLNGARSLSTLASGPNQSTLTTGGTRSVVKTGAGWTANDLVGRYLNITSGTGSGQVLVIAQNTTDTIYLAAPASPAIGAGAGFNIEDPSVVINSPIANGCGVYVEDNVAGLTINDVKVTGCTFGSIAINNPGRYVLNRLAVSGGTYGIFSQQCGYVAYSQCAAVGASTGFYFLQCLNIGNSIRGLLASGNSSAGLSINNTVCNGNAFTGVWIRGSASYGVFLLNTGLISISDLMVDSAQRGFYGQYCMAELTRPSINNCTVAPFVFAHPTQLVLQTSLDGTGNTGWGLNASGCDNVINVNGFTPTITGASGAVTVDGTNDVTWANLNTSGDYAVHVGSGCRIVRR